MHLYCVMISFSSRIIPMLRHYNIDNCTRYVPGGITLILYRFINVVFFQILFFHTLDLHNPPWQLGDLFMLHVGS
jgi:hypothetical protein